MITITERSAVRGPIEAIDLSSNQRIHTGSRPHPAFYSMGTGFLSWGQSGRSLQLNTHPSWYRGYERVDLHLYIPYTPSWRGQRNRTFVIISIITIIIIIIISSSSSSSWQQQQHSSVKSILARLRLDGRWFQSQV